VKIKVMRKVARSEKLAACEDLTSHVGRSKRIARIVAVLSDHSLPRNAVPIEKMEQAELAGFTGVRTLESQCTAEYGQDMIDSIRQEQAANPAGAHDAASYNILAISGGGAHGAFGAGFLYGWSQSGTRPEFKFVTGISTGAIIAPLAFLGPACDDILKQLYTTISTWNIYLRRNIVSWLWSESFADNAPLKSLIDQYVTPEALELVASVHRSGKRLYIGTTNLDAQQLVVWNMGAIADSGHPDAVDIFRKVLLASVSIPCVFPPVYFGVRADGHNYDEMHVDGGTIADVFVCDFMFDLQKARKEALFDENAEARTSLFIVRNDKMASSPEQVPRNLMKITRRALRTLNKAHGSDHIHRIYSAACRKGVDFDYAGIPEDCETANMTTFDVQKMTRLFDVGAELGASGGNWSKTPWPETKTQTAARQ
jgi:predicted acylesterase/phospholipase RssA